MKITVEISGCECEQLLAHLTRELRQATRKLARAVGENDPVFRSALRALGDSHMSNPVLQQLADQVTQTVGVIDSAVVLINGFAARIETAVEAAIANGATAEELAPVTDEIAAIKAKTDDLAAAVAANNPPPQSKKP